MANATWTDGREAGRDGTNLRCLSRPVPSPLRPAGHGGTLSRPVPVSRIASEFAKRVA